MMEDNKQLALRIDGAVQSASQEVTNLRAELTATNRRLAELSGGGGGSGSGPGAATSASAAAVTVADSAATTMENHQHSAQGRKRPAPGAGTQSALTGPSGSRARGITPTHTLTARWLYTVARNPFRLTMSTRCSPAWELQHGCH